VNSLSIIPTTHNFWLDRPLGIRNAPTVVLFKQQQELARIAGLKPKKQYLEMVQQAL
jgi:thioredoxin-like negative regulator of GroEL